MKVDKSIFLALVGSIFTGAGSVAAQEPAPPAPAPLPQPPPQPDPATAPSFGAPGTLAISSDANVGLSGSSISRGGGSSWTFTIAPAADYFLPVRGLSIGGQISYTHAGGPAQESSSNTFEIGPRVGYDITINDRFSIWPKLGFLVGEASPSGASATTIDVQVFVPALFHVDRHFFVGLGPGVQTDLWSSSGVRTTLYGLYFTLGGWTMIGG
jgi:hypothetical protein